jgi:uncharacterized protein YlxP (DUF503 family)
MTEDDRDQLDLETRAVIVVANVIGDNATTDDELAVAFILLRLVARLERLAGKTVH